ncbi:DNA polymerase kappa [Pancytospora philotis]|nr:DNA polymerase kappa [Pancytospora philotis]
MATPDKMSEAALQDDPAGDASGHPGAGYGCGDLQHSQDASDESDRAAGDDAAASAVYTRKPKEVGDVKLVLADDTQDNFDDKQERKMHKTRLHALQLQNRLKDGDSAAAEHGRILLEQELADLRRAWPALFGARPQRIYVHMDLDSFFASVETLLDPACLDVPMAVGSKMMLAAANYPAREYGVRAGMPGYQAKRLCPDLLIRAVHFDTYNGHSETTMGILSAYDPEIEIYGIDEACLIFDEPKLESAYAYYNARCADRGPSKADALGRGNGLGSVAESDNKTRQRLAYRGFDAQSVAELVDKIRADVHATTGLTISAGISVCRGLAKLASNTNKPNGQFAIEHDFDRALFPLPVDKINGIGKATKELLSKAFGIKLVRDLRDGLEVLARSFKAKTFSRLVRLSYGLSGFDQADDCGLYTRSALSHGMSVTIFPTRSTDTLLFYLLKLSEVVVQRFTRKGKAATCLTLTIKYSSYDSTTVRKNKLKPMTTQHDVFENALLLLNMKCDRDASGNYALDDAVRLLGLSAGDLAPLASLNPLDAYKNRDVPFKVRTCIVCGASFINETQQVFEAHVNNCLDRQQLAAKEPKDHSIMQYFRKS